MAGRGRPGAGLELWSQVVALAQVALHSSVLDRWGSRRQPSRSVARADSWIHSSGTAMPPTVTPPRRRWGISGKRISTGGRTLTIPGCDSDDRPVRRPSWFAPIA
jgi:hypothetical protein